MSDLSDLRMLTRSEYKESGLQAEIVIHLGYNLSPTLLSNTAQPFLSPFPPLPSFLLSSFCEYLNLSTNII